MVAEVITAAVVLSGWGINTIFLAEQKLDLIVKTWKMLRLLIKQFYGVEYSGKDLQKMQESLVKLNILLIKIKRILDHAVVDEVKDPGILFWLKRVQHSAYIAEELMDRFHIQYIQGSCGSCKNSNKALTCKNSKVILDAHLQKSLDEINELLNNTDTLINDYGWFKDSGLWKKSDSEVFNRIHESTGDSFDKVIYGRESVIKELLAKVEDMASPTISGTLVISVVGITGIGKTAVAQSVFCDSKIMDKKYVRVWFSMHQDFHLDMILKSIIESFSGEKFEVLNRHHLHAEFKRQIRGRSIFLVLDNARHELREDWSDLLRFISCAAKGSVVLVTTQSPVVSSIIGSQFKYELPKLSEEDCWSVFLQTAFPSQDYGMKHPELRCIGKEIVKRCYGLPLVASTLGHLLFGQDDIKEWECILKTDLWNLPVDMNAITHSLRSCYHQLPEHLKILVPYCGLLTRTFQFEKEMLVELWMSEELIQPKGNIQLEDLGSSYFDDLVNRGFFLPSSDDGVKFVVHGFFHDMVKLVNVDGSFRSIINERSDLLRNTNIVRHVSINMDGLKLDDLGDFERLRTILLLSGGLSINYLNPSRMPFVRVLDLSHSLIRGVPSTFSGLTQLRYLNVSYTPIKYVAEEVYEIPSLQTMKLRGCEGLTYLPEGIGKCKNLRHLDIDESSIFPTPPDIGEVIQLQGLRRFAVSSKGCKFNQLENLNMLRDSLHISGLEHVDTEDTSHGCLKGKGNLERLTLEWTSTQIIDPRVAQVLQPHHNLKELVIQKYPLQEWGHQEWIWNSSSSLQKIELFDCDNLRSISILRDLRSLKTLILHGNKSVENFDVQNFFLFEEPHRGFESLEVLSFVSWMRWTAWNVLEETHMPKLGKLSIRGCPRLTTVPNIGCLSLLKKLELAECNALHYSVGEMRPPQLDVLSIDRCRQLGPSAVNVEGWPFTTPPSQLA